MEEALPLIIHGCKLARELESNLHHFANQPGFLSNACDEIMKVFKKVLDTIACNDHLPVLEADHHGDVQDWLRSSYARTVDQYSTDDNKPLLESLTTGIEMLVPGEKSVTRSKPEESETGNSSVMQRSRKRKDGVKTITVRAAAPSIGNMEIPPGDGYIWRKYGQKEILEFVFPR
ncbi:hypothetical protein GIB67_041104 [Kingdonia uniflora]|uniref:WRKY domain-containing protein n=1 Tax=Kingdonia uniflora TaxID=39325 RepID=A0A7J7LK54_9MAGN|nr:hypothetical protein GIB67_041104 [Kingdonia uniflora]